MFTRVVTAPVAYPVTLAQAKEWCRIDSEDSSQDATLNLLIRAATARAEHLTGRVFVERTLETSFPYFYGCIELPFAPLLQVMSVSYIDLDEVLQEVATTVYEVDTVSQPGMIRPLLGQYWPSIGTTFNPVRIRYRAGYAGNGSPADLTDNTYLPPELLQFIHAWICTIYDNRAQMISNGGMLSIGPIPRDFADGALDSLVIGTRIF